jgi:hypothetical protein
MNKIIMGRSLALFAMMGVFAAGRIAERRDDEPGTQTMRERHDYPPTPVSRQVRRAMEREARKNNT